MIKYKLLLITLSDDCRKTSSKVSRGVEGKMSDSS